MNYSSIDVFVARWPLKLDFKSSILNVVQAPFVALFPTHWGLGINYTPTQIVNVALGLQANGATFLDIASDMYTLGVTPSQFRNAFLGINIAQ